MNADPMRCRDPARRRGGFTLVEVTVAILVSALMVTAFFSVAVSSRMQAGRVDRRAAATQQGRRLLEQLRNYVGDSGLTASLPNSGVLPNDSTSGGPWALANGSHTVTGLLSSDPAFTGTSATMTYFVFDGTAGCPVVASSIYGKCVNVTVTWQEQGT